MTRKTVNFQGNFNCLKSTYICWFTTNNLFTSWWFNRRKFLGDWWPFTSFYWL